MSFETLKKAIQSETDARVKAIEERYRAQRHQEEQRIKDQARAIEDSILDQGQATAEQQSQRLHQEHQLNAKAKVLTAKQTELATTREAVIDQIMQWNDDQLRELFTSLMEKLPDAKGTVVPGEKHAEIVRQIAKEKDLSVSEETIPHEGGFVYRTSQTQINFTISSLVDELFVRHRAAIAQKLFS